MCVDCVLASPRIAQVDPSDEPLPEVVLSQRSRASNVQSTRHQSSLPPCLVKVGSGRRGVGSASPACGRHPIAARRGCLQGRWLRRQARLSAFVGMAALPGRVTHGRWGIVCPLPSSFRACVTFVGFVSQLVRHGSFLTRFRSPISKAVVAPFVVVNVVLVVAFPSVAGHEGLKEPTTVGSDHVACGLSPSGLASPPPPSPFRA
jgi:hypothetical protein